MPFLRQRQLDDLIESIDHLATVNADLIDVISTTAGKWEAKNTPRRRVSGWIPVGPRTDATAARTEALGIVEEVHRAQDRTDDEPLLDADTPGSEKEACS